MHAYVSAFSPSLLPAPSPSPAAIKSEVVAVLPLLPPLVTPVMAGSTDGAALPVLAGADAGTEESLDDPAIDERELDMSVAARAVLRIAPWAKHRCAHSPACYRRPLQVYCQR